MRQNQTAVSADDSGDCWLGGKVGQCCSTKCNGKSDSRYEGTFFNCKAGTCSGMLVWCCIHFARMILRTPYPTKGVPVWHGKSDAPPIAEMQIVEKKCFATTDGSSVGPLPFFLTGFIHNVGSNVLYFPFLIIPVWEFRMMVPIH